MDITLKDNIERVEAKFNAVVTQLIRIQDDENGNPQYARYTHIECKDEEMQEPLLELARELT